jgi:hypothetical protein
MAPRARSSDPWTSHAAAESVRSLNKKQSEVLKVFKTYGRMTDEDLLRLHKGMADFGQLEVQSDSGEALLAADGRKVPARTSGLPTDGLTC